MKLYKPLALVLVFVFIVNTVTVSFVNYLFSVETTVQEIVFLIIFSINGLASVCFSFLIYQKHHRDDINKLVAIISTIESGQLSARIECDDLSDSQLILVAHGINRMAGAIELKTDQLEDMALFDELTHLHNRHFFIGRAHSEVAMANLYKYSVTILMIDIDFFKKVNDQYGHQMGDDVLKEVALLLSEAIRHADVLARYGGEEFIVLLPKANIAVAKAVAKRILLNVAQHPFGGPALSFKVTVSIGLAEWHEDFVTLEDFIKVADRALYLAKERGRNRIEVLNS